MKQEQRKNSTVKAVVGIVGVLVLVVAWLSWKAPDLRVPEYLLGEWHTTEAQHADRYFEITPVSVSFTTGDGNGYTGFIKDVKKTQEGPKTLYTVIYEVDGARNEVSFYYEPKSATEMVIRFKNQPKVEWKKSEGI